MVAAIIGLLILLFGIVLLIIYSLAIVFMYKDKLLGRANYCKGYHYYIKYFYT